MTGIKPLGGKLINRVLDSNSASKIIEQSNEFQKIKLSQDLVMDVEKIAIGSFSPLEGFMNHDDYISVLNDYRLSNGIIWTLPVTLNVSKEDAKRFKGGEEIALTDDNDDILAIMGIEEKYEQNKEFEAQKIFGTLDKTHPGVAHTFNMNPVLLAGKIHLLKRPESKFREYELTPEETRNIFKEKKWNTVVAFHTRNAPHRAHEFLQKAALEMVDGLFIQPVIGRKKQGDYNAETILKCYKVLVEKFYPKNRVLLAALSTYSRYAGPREAIFTGLVRQNYGATHFIVGRDHTGVGNFYDKYASHKLYKELMHELDFTPLFFYGPSYCKKCECITTEKTCPHDEEDKLEISGTKMRALLKNGEKPPREFMRPEVYEHIDENSFTQ